MTAKTAEEAGIIHHQRPKYDPTIGKPGDVEIPNRIFVKGFPKDASEDDIKEFFETFGIVRHTKIVCDKTGASKGYAFVTFDSQGVAESVREMGTLKHNDREIIIGPAKIKKKRLSLFGGFRPRPDQMGFWPPNNMAPQIPYYAVSPDGAWYYQVQPTIQVPQYSTFPIANASVPAPAAPVQFQQYEYQPIPQQLQQVPVWPQQAPVTILQSNQPTQVLTTPTAQNLQQTTPPHIAGAAHSPAFPLNVNNLTERMSAVSLNEYIKLSSRKNSPTEGIEYQQLQTTPPGHSPPQCVPVYENSLLHEDAILTQDGMEHSNVVYLDAGKLKTVVVKRDLPKHVHGAFLPASGVQAAMI